MITKKFVVLFTIIMLLINDAVLVGGYFYLNSHISEVETINETEAETAENNGPEIENETTTETYLETKNNDATEDNNGTISIDECFGTYHLKGYQTVDGNGELHSYTRVVMGCDCEDKDNDDESGE